MMKAKSKPPKGTHNYYMVHNVEPRFQIHFKWYLDKVCLLVKSNYMSKKLFAPPFTVEQGIVVDCTLFFLEKLESTIITKDEHRSIT